MKNSTRLLISGDILAIAIVTLIGFATHNEADLSFLPRMLAAFFPVTLSWFLLAPWFGLFQPEITSNPRQLWRPVLAMLFAAPLAALLRGLILNAPIIPVFGLVLASTSALGMLIWREIYVFLKRK
jgi:flagellar biosynthesis protein FliQ